MSQAHDLHRALLRPAVIHTLRAVGFHSTKPSVLDTLTNIAERYLLLLASTTAQHALSAHNDPIPTISDVRMALTDCGVLIPASDAAEEEWKEVMRVPLEDLSRAVEKGGEQRKRAEKRKREDEDLQDVRRFQEWFGGGQHNEIRRVAGMMPDPTSTGALPAVGVGGGLVQAEDFLTVLKKKQGKVGDDSRLQGTVLGVPAEDREVLVEGGPVQRIQDWRPKLEERSENMQADRAASRTGAESPDSGTLSEDTAKVEDALEA